jgi:hypothetical protein
MQESTPPSPDSAFQALECPRCKAATFSLKCYTLDNFYCLIFYMAWKSERVLACPACMRQLLFENSLINLVTANLGSPVPLFKNLFLFMGTFRRGHSRSIQRMLRPLTSEEQAEFAVSCTLVGAFVGALLTAALGALAGLQGGALAWRFGASLTEESDRESVSMLGAYLAGCLVALLFAWSKRQLPWTLLWGTIGAGAWALAHWLGGQPFDRAVGDPAMHWTIIGALAATLGGTRGFTIRFVRKRTQTQDAFDDPVLLSLLVKSACKATVRDWVWWSVVVSGAIGGILIGAAGGALLGFFSSNAAAGAGIGAVAGALGGGSGGAAVAREQRSS